MSENLDESRLWKNLREAKNREKSERIKRDPNESDDI